MSWLINCWMFWPANPASADSRNVEHVESVGNVYADVSRELMVDLKDANVDHHLRTCQSLAAPASSRKHRAAGARTAHFDGIRRLARTDIAQIEHVAHRVDQIGGFLRCGFRRQEKGRSDMRSYCL